MKTAAAPMTCKEAREKIDAVAALKIPADAAKHAAALKGLCDALESHVWPLQEGRTHLKCSSCWNYYLEAKSKSENKRFPPDN